MQPVDFWPHMLHRRAVSVVAADAACSPKPLPPAVQRHAAAAAARVLAPLPEHRPTPRCAAAAKSDRLKQAKEEAEREIAAFKAEREAEFRGKVRCCLYFVFASLLP